MCTSYISLRGKRFFFVTLTLMSSDCIMNRNHALILILKSINKQTNSFYCEIINFVPLVLMIELITQAVVNLNSVVFKELVQNIYFKCIKFNDF